MTEQIETPQDRFAQAVIRLIDTIFNGTRNQLIWKGQTTDFLTLDKGLYSFNFYTTAEMVLSQAAHTQRSDSLSEIAELAIRRVEKELTSRLVPGGCPYTIVKLGLVPDEEFAKCFKVLERPYRLEMYTDTFRKGVLELRKLYCV